MLNRREFVWGAAAGVGAMTVLASETAEGADPTMSLNVVYPNKEGARFDANYYRATHIPMAMNVMKATSVLLIEGVANANAPAPFAMIAHFKFPSADALKTAVSDPRMAEVRADVAKFTDIVPTVMIGKTV